MIVRGSRYETATSVRIKRADGSSAVALYASRQVFVQPMEYVTHLMVGGERLEHIAASAYGDSTLWWIIARANPEVFYPDDFPPGTGIRIPNASAVR